MRRCKSTRSMLIHSILETDGVYRKETVHYSLIMKVVQGLHPRVTDVRTQTRPSEAIHLTSAPLPRSAYML